MTAQAQQRRAVFQALDTFGDDRMLKRAGQAHHAVDDGQVLRILQHVLHESLIDLQAVHRQPVKVGQ